MSIQQSIQHYTPLTKEELKRVEKALKSTCKDLLVRVYSQLSVQEDNNNLRRAHIYKINASIADQLRDLADSVETLEDHQCNHD